MLIDSGRLRRADDGWRAVGDLDDIAVPPTIRALLAARARRAARRRTPDPRGRRSRRAGVLARGGRGDRPTSSATAPVSLLAELLRKDLVVPDVGGPGRDGGFRFRHILIRDAAYDAIPKLDRAAMHEQFAAWLDDAYVGRTAEVEEILGYHLQEAYRSRVALGPADAATLAPSPTALLGTCSQRASSARSQRLPRRRSTSSAGRTRCRETRRRRAAAGLRVGARAQRVVGPCARHARHGDRGGRPRR